MGKSTATHRQTVEAPAQLKALHAAVVKVQRENGTLGDLIPLRQWHGIIIQSLGTLTRQSCHDKTWALEALGLLEYLPREGVIMKERVQG